MKSNEIEQLVEKIRLRPDEAASERIIARAEAALDKSTKTKSTPAEQNTWRTIIHSRITRFATAAVIIVTVFIGMRVFSGTITWADVIKALDSVNQVHIDVEYTLGNGQKMQGQYWFRRAGFFRSQSPEQEIIDNGSDRLSLDIKQKTAQLGDSFERWEPISKHHMFAGIGLFRRDNPDGIELKQVPAESNSTTIVYTLRYKEPILEGKAWVQASTMLPLRMELAMTRPVKPSEPNSGIITFNYQPIPDEVFATAIPEGYKELPRKKRGEFSGKVIDRKGNPVVGAHVYVKPSSLIPPDLKQLEGSTDARGLFSLKIPPTMAGVFTPVMVYAIVPGDPHRIAWTMIKGAKDKLKNLGGTIPGNPGSPQFPTPEDNQGRMYSGDYGCSGSSGIVLQLADSGVISGTVKDTQDHTVANASIMVTFDLVDKFGNIVHSIWPWQTTATTGPEGAFTVGPLPALWDKTIWQIRTEAEGHFRSNLSFKSEGPLGNKQMDIELISEGNVAVSGTLIDNYGQALAERIIAANVDTCRLRSTLTDKQGRFRLNDLPDIPNLIIKAILSTNNVPEHETEKYQSFVYYPDTAVQVEHKPGKAKYQVKLVAEKPEFTIEIEVVDSSGQPIPYCPVELQQGIWHPWKLAKGFARRTDEKGRCRLTEVPNIKGMELAVYPGNSVRNDSLTKDQRNKIRNKYKKYEWKQIPLEFIAGKKLYKIRTVILTREERQRQ